MSKKTNKSSSLKDWLLIVVMVLGFLTTVVAFIGDFLQWIQDPQAFRYLSIAGFALLVVGILWFYFRAENVNQKRRSVSLAVLCVVTILYSFWMGTWVEPSTPTCSDYGIRITSPTSGATVGERFEVSGSFEVQPPEGSVILIVKSPDRSEYWPSSTPVEIDPVLRTWGSEAFIFGDPPLNQDIVVAITGRSGRALLEYYLKVGQQTGQWHSINILTDDIQICDRASVTKK